MAGRAALRRVALLPVARRCPATMSALESHAPIGVRIVVTGMAGAGKSTFSRLLSAKCGLPVVCLDLHRWSPGWVRVPADEFLEKQRALLAADRWIVDSNDVDEALVFERADTLVILATPWWVCAWRAFLRGLRRPRHTLLPDGCDESLPQRIRDEWGIVWRNWRTRRSVAASDQLLASRCRGRMRVWVLHSRRDATGFLAAL